MICLGGELSGVLVVVVSGVVVVVLKEEGAIVEVVLVVDSLFGSCSFSCCSFCCGGDLCEIKAGVSERKSPTMKSSKLNQD